MSDLRREQIELHISKLIPSSLGISKDANGVVDEGKRVKTLKSMVALASFNDAGFIFKCFEQRLSEVREEASASLKKLDKILAPDALLGIKANSIAGITDYTSLQQAALAISNNIGAQGKQGGASAEALLQKFLDDQIKPQLSGTKKETVVPLLKNLFSSFYSMYAAFQTDISGLFNPIENYSKADVSRVLSEDVLMRAQQELVSVLVELSSTINESDQGRYIEETAVITTAVKNVVKAILSDPKDPKGTKLAGVFSTGSSGKKSSYLRGKLKSEPPDFLYKAPFGVFIDYAMAENTGTSPASTTKRASYPLTPANGGSVFTLASVSGSDFLELDINGIVIKRSKDDLALGSTASASAFALALSNSTTLLTTPTDDGYTSYLRTNSENGNLSKITILSSSSETFTDAISITVDKRYKGKLTVNQINTANVNSYLSASNSYFIYIVGEGSFQVSSFTNTSIVINGEITASLTATRFIVTQKKLGTLVYPTSSLTTPISETFPVGRTLTSLWRDETNGNYEVPYIAAGSSGSLIKEVALFGRMSNYVYQSETGKANPIKVSGTTGWTRKPKYTSQYGQLGTRVSTLRGGRVVTGATIGKPLVSVSTPILIYLPSSRSGNTYVMNSSISGSSDPNYDHEDFSATIGSFARLGDYIEVSDSGSSYNTQSTSTSSFEGATFRVRKFSSTYSSHTSGLPSIQVLPDYDVDHLASYASYVHFDDTGFKLASFFDNYASANVLVTDPHAELDIDIVQIHRFKISSGDFDALDVSNGDYLMVHPVSGTHVASNWNSTVLELSYSKFFEIVSKGGRKDLILNTGWANSDGSDLSNSTTSYSSPFYDTTDKLDGLFHLNVSSTRDLWQDRDPTSGHRFFVFKKGRTEYDAEGTTILIDDAHYSFTDDSATFSQSGVQEGYLFSIDAVGNADPYNIYGATFESGATSSLNGYSDAVIGLVESDNRLYVYGSTDSSAKENYGKVGFRYTCSNISYSIRDSRYRKIIKDENATFITDNVKAGMFVRVYERAGTAIDYSLIVDSVISETEILMTTDVYSGNASETSIKFYISTNSDENDAGNSTRTVKLNIHADYNFDVFNSGVTEGSDYVISYLDSDGVSTTLLSKYVIDIKSDGFIKISASAISHSNLPAFYNTPFCITKAAATTSLFQQSTDLTTYSGFPNTTDIETETRSLQLRILGGRESDVAGKGGLNQYESDNFIIRLSSQLDTNVAISGLTTSPEADVGKPSFSGADTSLVFGLAGGNSVKRFYGNFTSSDSKSEIVWNPGDSTETRYSAKTGYSGYVDLAESINTITSPDVSFTSISGRNTLGIPYYAVIASGTPTAGNEIVYGAFRSKIKQITEARTRRYSSPSDVDEFKVVYELFEPYPISEDISNYGYVVDKGSDPRSLTLVASLIEDQDGVTSPQGFLSADINKATVRIYGSNPLERVIDRVSGKYKLNLTEELPQVIEDTEFSVNMGFFDTIDTLKSGQALSDLSLLDTDSKIAIWGDSQVYSVSVIPTSSDIKISPNMVAGKSDLTLVSWKNGSDYYGQYLMIKHLVEALSFTQDLSLLSRYFNEVIASYGSDKVTIYSYGNLVGTTKVVELDDTTVLSTSGFTDVQVGDKITAVVYADGAHTTTETYVKEKVSSSEIRLYENLLREVVYLKIERSAVSYSISILQSIHLNLSNLIKYVDEIPSLRSPAASSTMTFLQEEGLDNGLSTLKKDGLSAFLNLSSRDFSSQGSLNKSLEELGSSFYTE